MTIYIYRVNRKYEGLLCRQLDCGNKILMPIGKIIVRKRKKSGYEETLNDIEEMAVQAYAKGAKQITARWDEKYYDDFDEQ